MDGLKFLELIMDLTAVFFATESLSVLPPSLKRPTYLRLGQCLE
jgi:hypothetical protein